MSTQPSTYTVPEWTLGDRLRKARELAGLSQKEMAAAVGIARNTVGNYELGDTEPMASTLGSWARVCGVPAEWLAWGSSTPQKDPGAGGPKVPNNRIVQKPPGYRSTRHLVLAA